MAWYETQARYKPDKVVVKIRDDDGRFQQAVIIPTIKYPLNGPYQVFHAGNTCPAKEEMFEAIDKVEYKIGQCYTNTKCVVNELRKAGYDAVSYAGWFFVGEGIPIHHCWTVVEGNILIDLADDYAMQKAVFPGIEEFDKTAAIKATADFIRQTKEWRNSDRCYPVGCPHPVLYYVGCPCEPEEAVRIWWNLIRTFPNHECRTDYAPNNRSETQQYLYEQGLM